jgi:hypothetical protein
MIDRVKSGIGAVNRSEKRQNMRSAEQARKLPSQKRIQCAETSARKAVDIGNELNLIFHNLSGFQAITLPEDSRRASGKDPNLAAKLTL